MDLHPYITQTQETPNPLAYKFCFNADLLAEGYLQFEKTEAGQSGLTFIDKLLEHPEIIRVYIAADFLTVIKTEDSDWISLAPVVRDIVLRYVRVPEFASDTVRAKIIHPQLSQERMLTEFFNTRVLPATEGDGGGIFPKSYENGVLVLEPVGACRGCPYAKDTVEKGIAEPLSKLLSDLRKIRVI